MRSLIPFSLLLSLFPVRAVRVPFQVRYTNGPTNPLARRASNIPISNIGNAQYVSNVTLGGVQLPVLLDTGSSDLWVNFQNVQPSNVTDLGKSITLSYAVGKASGNIHAAHLQFGDYAVDSQVFLNVDNTSSFTSDIHAQGYGGLLGLGPNSGSLIRKNLDASDGSGDSMLTRIFDQDPTSANYISILLNRQNDPGSTLTGQFTISEVVPGFENITSMPRLDVETVYRILSEDQHWQALADKLNGIIGPDGQVIPIKSIVPKAPSGQLVAVFDSGFTFSQVPRSVSDHIYGRVQGAFYDSSSEFWMIPCGQYLNITFMFGGIAYPIHPLDTVDNNFARVDPTGKPVCIGAFQPITSAFSLFGQYDMILGMSFLRNAYTLMDFGSWVHVTNKTSSGHPFIQMVSLVDVASARADFVKVRLSGNDTINDPRWGLLPPSQMQSSPVSAEERKKKYQEMILSRWPYILLGCLIFIVALLGICIWRCCLCRRRSQRAKRLPPVTISLDQGWEERPSGDGRPYHGDKPQIGAHSYNPYVHRP